jgi:sugar lactone lactonase YvrE
MKGRVAGIVLLVAAAWCSCGQDSVTTLAGHPLVSGASNGPVATALFSDPAGLVADAAGNLFIADSQNHVVRKIGTNGLVVTFAGQAGTPGSIDGTGSQARFDTPTGIAIATNGHFYISDTGNHTVRRMTASGAVTTAAGWAGQSGFTNGWKTGARFNSPLGLAVAVDGTIFVADSGNHLVRTIAPDGTVTTVAGRAESWGSQDGAGENARFNGPLGIAIDSQGDLFLSDANNHTIRRITRTGVVTTWAGTPGVDGFVDGDRLHARFSKPAELAFDKHGSLFVADSFNHVIRKISRAGKVSTVTGIAGAEGSTDGNNGQAQMFNPYGLAVHSDGSLIVADAYNQLIRIVLAPFGVALHISPGNVSMSWESVIGQTYQAQYRTELGSVGWMNLGLPVTATNVSTSVADWGRQSTSRRIYRVVLP